jgi:signal transduction histidine kinase
MNFAESVVELAGELETELDPRTSALPAAKQRVVSSGLSDLREAAGKIFTHGKRAAQIVDNMLQHARTGSGNREATDLNALLTAAVQLAITGARANDPTFAIDLDMELDPSIGAIDAVASDMSRVFGNLLSNACYALRQRQTESQGKHRPRLTVRSVNHGGRVEVRIRDNGTGIPERVKEQIFEPFFTTKPAGQGTGLGLSLSREIIVDGHQGSLDVDTRAGEYTEFKVTLPRK